MTQQFVANFNSAGSLIDCSYKKFELTEKKEKKYFL